MDLKSLSKLSDIAEIKISHFNDLMNFEDSVWINSVGDLRVLSDFDEIEKYRKYPIQITPNEGILKEFLIQVIKRPLKEFKDNSVKTVLKLNVKDLEEFKIPVPDIKKQEKILKSKNIEERVKKLWLEYGVKTYEDKFKVDMDFDDLLKLLV